MLLTRDTTASTPSAPSTPASTAAEPGGASPGAVPDADDATAVALLNCLVREVSAPERQARPAGGHLVVHLARAGITLRARLPRTPAGPSVRLAPPIEEERRAGDAACWSPVGWARLAELVAAELELATGIANPEFLEQVSASNAAMRAIALRIERTGQDGQPWQAEHAGRGEGATGVRAMRPVDQEAFIAAEQSLVTGHRFHPAPKARQGDPGRWLPFAPEAGARFRLRWLAVRDELVAGEGDQRPFETLGPAVPEGYRALPAHPWQLSLIGDRPALHGAFRDGAVLDLGPAGPVAAPTSSVRTVYLPGRDLFAKFSLDVRITNCVRRNSWYELTGAVLLDGLLRPVFDDLGARFDGCVLLPEPAYRSIALSDRRVHEGLSVILRGGIAGCRATPVPAAAIADPYGRSPASVVRLLAGEPAEHALAWWDAYVRLVVPPVLHAYLAHGVVLEPHLQNVLIAVGPDRMPAQAVFRDLEGTKLVGQVWSARRTRPGSAAEALAGVPDRVLEALTYDAERGWNRVVYCLFVNHLAEVCTTIGDLHPRLEPALWRTVRNHVVRYAEQAGATLQAVGREEAADDGAGALAFVPGGQARLRALLAGVPLPAKANLRARWRRSADREAGYVDVPNPLGPPRASGAHHDPDGLGGGRSDD